MQHEMKNEKKTIWVFLFQHKANFYGQTHQVHLDSTFQSPCLPGLEIPGLDPSLQHTVHPPSKFFLEFIIVNLMHDSCCCQRDIFICGHQFSHHANGMQNKAIKSLYLLCRNYNVLSTLDSQITLGSVRTKKNFYKTFL